jgi:hypothetical protein
MDLRSRELRPLSNRELILADSCSIGLAAASWSWPEQLEAEFFQNGAARSTIGGKSCPVAPSGSSAEVRFTAKMLALASFDQEVAPTEQETARTSYGQPERATDSAGERRTARGSYQQHGGATNSVAELQTAGPS